MPLFFAVSALLVATTMMEAVWNVRDRRRSTPLELVNSAAYAIKNRRRDGYRIVTIKG